MVIVAVLLLLLLLLIIIIIIIIVSCHRPFLPDTSLGPAVIPTAQASSFKLQYFPVVIIIIIIIIIIIGQILVRNAKCSPSVSFGAKFVHSVMRFVSYGSAYENFLLQEFWYISLIGRLHLFNPLFFGLKLQM